MNGYPCNGYDEDCDGVDGCVPDRDSDGDPDATDCAPDDSSIGHRGYEISCDGIDQTCDGLDPCDHDGDHESEDTDCNDSDPTIGHSATELICDDVDQNCDGSDCCEQDLDGDGYPCRIDCNDRLQRVHPGAARSIECDYEDRDCDGAIDFTECF